MATFSIDAKVCSFAMTESFDLSNNNGKVAMDVHVVGTAVIGSAANNVFAAVQGDLVVTEDSFGNCYVAGSASASIGITVAGTGHSTTVAGFKFNNNGFSIDIWGYDAQVNW
jgi:hypothetical protein